jgi:hypothetical protein
MIKRRPEGLVGETARDALRLVHSVDVFRLQRVQWLLSKPYNLI